MSPTIYLNDYYREYRDGTVQVPAVVQDIIRIYEENYMPTMVDGKMFTDFENVKEIICFKLIRLERNGELLKEIPHVPVLDLAMVFYVLIKNSERGEMTALVKDEHLKLELRN